MNVEMICMKLIGDRQSNKSIFCYQLGCKHLIAETSVLQFRVGHKGFAHSQPESLLHDKKYVMLACGHDFSEDACM